MSKNLFQFSMNNRTFTIYEVNQNDLMRYKNEETGYFYGQSHFKHNEVWLDKDLTNDIKRETLYHELLHCYIVSFITTQDIEHYDEELMCDISARSHNLIHKIVDDYFKYLEENNEK